MTYSRAIYNRKFGQQISTDAPDTGVLRAFLAHLHIPKAAAESDNGILPLTNLGAAAQEIKAGLVSPAVPRNLKIKGNVAGINKDVVITGTNYADDEITETITADGTSGVPGYLAFKTVTKVELPIQNHTPAAQTETIEVTNECTLTEEITVTVTAPTLLGDASPASVAVSLDSTVHTTVDLVAAAVVAALNADDDIKAAFEASSEGAVITLATLGPVANDSSLVIAFTVGTSGVTVGASTNGVSGVPVDQISVGWGKKFGTPYMLSTNGFVLIKLFDGSADTGIVTADADELEKNVIALNGTPDGLKDIDLYIVV